jgi:hypothetical protein
MWALLGARPRSLHGSPLCGPTAGLSTWPRARTPLVARSRRPGTLMESPRRGCTVESPATKAPWRVRPPDSPRGHGPFWALYKPRSASPNMESPRHGHLLNTLTLSLISTWQLSVKCGEPTGRHWWRARREGSRGDSAAWRRGEPTSHIKFSVENPATRHPGEPTTLLVENPHQAPCRAPRPVSEVKPPPESRSGQSKRFCSGRCQNIYTIIPGVISAPSTYF